MRIEDDVIDRPAEEGARLLALALLDEADEAAGRLGKGDDAEALHDFRVGLRRLRSTLRALRPWLEDSVKRKLERRVRRHARMTNAARDAEVQLAWLGGKLEALSSPRVRPGLDALLERFRARALSDQDQLRTVRRWRATSEKLERRLGTDRRRVEPESGPGGASLGGVLATLVGDHLEAMRERLEGIRGPSDQEGVHQTRIEGKRLRYLLEPLRGHRHADAGEAVKGLKRLQDLLGDLHDAHVLAARGGRGAGGRGGGARPTDPRRHLRRGGWRGAASGVAPEPARRAAGGGAAGAKAPRRAVGRPRPRVAAGRLRGPRRRGAGGGGQPRGPAREGTHGGCGGGAGSHGGDGRGGEALAAGTGNRRTGPRTAVVAAAVRGRGEAW